MPTVKLNNEKPLLVNFMDANEGKLMEIQTGGLKGTIGFRHINTFYSVNGSVTWFLRDVTWINTMVRYLQPGECVEIAI